MIDPSKHRWLIVAVVHYVTLFFVTQFNHYLTPYGLHIFILGMLVSFSAMELSFKQGLSSLIPVALFLDTKSPFPFGFTLTCVLCLFTIAYVARSRVRREVTASSLASSIMFNLAAFLAYTFGAIFYLGIAGMSFGVLAVNLSLSALVIMLFNSLFFEVQFGVLSIFGINLAEEQRQAR